MNPLGVKEKTIIEEALQIVEQQLHGAKGESLCSSGAAKRMAQLKLSLYEHEVFAAFLLDTQHRIIEYREFFNGTIDGCTVYPREVVRACIETNTAAVVLLHNHPSGELQPSNSDQQITQRLVNALSLVDVRVIDHLIVGGSECYSFADCGILPCQQLR